MTRLLHAPRESPAVIGRHTPCNGDAHAHLDDVAGGTTTSVDFIEEFFTYTATLPIYNSTAGARAVWDGDATLRVIGPAPTYTHTHTPLKTSIHLTRVVSDST